MTSLNYIIEKDDYHIKDYGIWVDVFPYDEVPDPDTKEAERFHKKFSPEAVKTYCTVGGTPHLDGDYTVFGEVVEGMEVVDRIASTKTGAMDRPIEDVRIVSMKILK